MVQLISGDKTIAMVMLYNHQNDEHVQQAMGKAEQR